MHSDFRDYKASSLRRRDGKNGDSLLIDNLGSCVQLAIATDIFVASLEEIPIHFGQRHMSTRYPSDLISVDAKCADIPLVCPNNAL